MRLGKFVKSPDEAKRYKIDYVNWLDTSEYVSSATFATISTNTGTITCVPDTIGATDTSLSYFVTGGNAGQTYEVRVRMITSANQVKEDTIQFQIKAL